MKGAVEERLIRLWTSPQGAPKAALAEAVPARELGSQRGACGAVGDDTSNADAQPESGTGTHRRAS
jgi:hypothetical protein